MTKQTYTVEFFDNFQGMCLMDVEAQSAKQAMRIVNDLLKRNCAIHAYLYN